MMKKIKQNFDTSIATSVNIKANWTLTWKNEKYSLKTQKSKFYYKIIINNKFEPNYMQKKWENDYTLENTDWTNIYYNKVWNVKDKKLAEYNYKLLNNIRLQALDSDVLYCTMLYLQDGTLQFILIHFCTVKV